MFAGGQDAPQTVGSGNAADQTVAGGRGGRGNVAAPPGEDDYEGSDDQDGAHQAPEDLENFSDDAEEDDDQDIEWNENTAKNTPHSISNKPHAFPPDSQKEISAFTMPVLESSKATTLDLGSHESTSLQTDSEKTDTGPQVDDLTQIIGREDGTAEAAAPRAESEHAPESSMSPEQRIKQLEERVAKLNALRLVDSATISRSYPLKNPFYICTEYLSLSGLTKKADTAFDNMSVLLSRVHMHRQELETTVTKHIESVAHQKPFKSLIDKMDETSVSATQILVFLDKRKTYVMPKTRVPVIITDEEGQEWVPWDVISDDSNDLRDTVETEKKRRRDNNGANGEASSKRRKC